MFECPWCGALVRRGDEDCHFCGVGAAMRVDTQPESRYPVVLTLSYVEHSLPLDVAEEAGRELLAAVARVRAVHALQTQTSAEEAHAARVMMATSEADRIVGTWQPMTKRRTLHRVLSVTPYVSERLGPRVIVTAVCGCVDGRSALIHLPDRGMSRCRVCAKQASEVLR